MSEIERGLAAERLMNDPTLKEAFEGVRQGLLRKLEDVAIGDVDTQHNLTLCLQCLRSIKAQLANYIAYGQLEQMREKTRVVAKRTRQPAGM